MRPLVTLAPWTRGPALILRAPLALVAIVAAATVLGLVAAGGPLFIASVGTGALHVAAAKNCAQDDQISVINPALNVYLPVPAGPQAPSSVQGADPVVRNAFAAVHLPAPQLTTYATVPTGDTSGQRPTEVGLFANDQALGHVDLLEHVNGDGVYITDTYAHHLDLHAGDQLPRATGPIRIAGVYRNLDTASYRTVLPEFWCHWRSLIVTSASSAPPPFVLTDQATVAALGSNVQAEWTSPTDIDQLTVADAQVVAAAGRSMFTPAAIAPDNSTSAVAGYGVATQLDFDLAQTSKLRSAVGTPVAALAVAGGALALVLVGGSVLFWAQRRRPELRLLSSRGVGPFALGLKAASELGLPAAAGCVLGWAIGLLVVPLLGPSSLTEPGAPVRGLLAAGAAWIGCLVTVGSVGMLAVSERRRRPAPRLVQAGCVAAALAPIAGAAWLLQGADLNQLVRPGIYLIDPALLLSPILAVTGLVLAAALAAAAPLQPARRAVRRRSFPVFAAVNRAAAARGPLIAVICGLGIPTALAVYSAGFTASSQATIQAKADTYTGAAVVLDVRVPLGRLPDPGSAGTPISYALGDALDADGERTGDIELLGLDPATFTRYAFADQEVTGKPVRDLIDRLGARSGAQPVPALLVGAGDTRAPVAVQIRGSTLPVDVVDTAPAFPGMRYPHRPMLVVDRQTLTGLDPYGGWHNELWTDQRHAGSLLAGLTDQGILTDAVDDPATFIDATSLLPVTWTFDFLRALSTLLAGISIAGLLLFLAARQQRQEAAYVLIKRMGVTPRGYLHSLLLEIGSLCSWAWLAGCLTGTLALLVATRVIDVNPGFPPPTLLRLPLPTALLAAAFLGLAAAALTWWTTRQAERAQPAAVLRA